MTKKKQRAVIIGTRKTKQYEIIASTANNNKKKRVEAIQNLSLSVYLQPVYTFAHYSEWLKCR